jgi:hypothetical protein
MLLIRN